MFFYHASFAGWVSFLPTMIIFQTFLFVDPTSCNSKLKVSSYCILSLMGDVRDILDHEAQTKCRFIICNKSKPSSS